MGESDPLPDGGHHEDAQSFKGAERGLGFYRYRIFGLAAVDADYFDRTASGWTDKIQEDRVPNGSAGDSGGCGRVPEHGIREWAAEVDCLCGGVGGGIFLNESGYTVFGVLVLSADFCPKGERTGTVLYALAVRGESEAGGGRYQAGA